MRIVPDGHRPGRNLPVRLTHSDGTVEMVDLAFGNQNATINPDGTMQPDWSAVADPDGNIDAILNLYVGGALDWFPNTDPPELYWVSDGTTLDVNASNQAYVVTQNPLGSDASGLLLNYAAPLELDGNNDLALGLGQGVQLDGANDLTLKVEANKGLSLGAAGLAGVANAPITVGALGFGLNYNDWHFGLAAGALQVLHQAPLSYDASGFTVDLGLGMVLVAGAITTDGVTDVYYLNEAGGGVGTFTFTQGLLSGYSFTPP